MVKKIFGVIFWLLFLLIAFIAIRDYVHIQNEEPPQFCISKKVIEFDDGTVDVCTGLGYKIFYYNRSSMEVGYDFGWLFKKMQESD